MIHVVLLLLIPQRATNAGACSDTAIDTDKTGLSCLVLSAVWTEFATSQDCRRQKISNLFCRPVSKCGVNRVMSCLDLISNLQQGLVYKGVYTADRTGQNCSVSNILTTKLSWLVAISVHTIDKTRQSCVVGVGGVICREWLNDHIVLLTVSSTTLCVI